MRVRVLFFGALRDLVGSLPEDAEFPEGMSLGGIFASYAERFPGLREMESSLRMARNREFAAPSTVARPGDEVAFLPPVSGGAEAAAEITEDGNYFALTRRPIEPRELAARLMTGAEGAVVTFEGTVRNQSWGRRTRFLDYEAYEPMALREMARIGGEIARARPIGRIGMAHRLGRLLIGETAVAVVVCAAHRRPAFEAALEGIDRLKKSVPIWKKEYFVDGEVWAEGNWDAPVPTVR